jgi:hypothetical protein
MSFTPYGSPATENLNVYVVNPVTATFTESTIGVTQSTSPWVISGTVTANQGGTWNIGTLTSVTNAVTVQQGSAANLLTTSWTDDGFGNPINSTPYGSPAVRALDVYVVNPESGSVTVSGNVTVVQPSGSNLHVDVDNFPSTQNVAITSPVDGSGYVEVDLKTAIPAGSNTIGAVNIEASGVPLTVTNYGSPAVEALNVYVTNPVSGTVSVSGTVAVTQSGAWTVAVTQSTSPWVVSGTVAVSGSVAVTNAALGEMTFTNYGSPAEEALNVYVVNPSSGSVTVSGIVQVSPTSAANTSSNPFYVEAVSGSTTVVTGTVAVTQSTSPWVVSNPALSEMTFTNYGSPAEESLNVYVVNPVTATFTESTIGVTQSTSPWVVSGNGNFTVVQPSGASLHVDVDNFPSAFGITGVGTTTAGSPAATGLDVYVIGGSVAVTGTVSVGNTVTVTGTVAATQSGPWSVGVTGTVAVTQSTSPWITNIEASGIPLTATNYGSPPVESLNVYVVNPSSSVTVAGTVAVTQSTSPWVVSGTVTVSGTVAVTQSGTWTVGVTGQSYTTAGSPPVSALNVYVEGGTVASTQSGAWTVAATQSGAWNVGVTGTVGVTQSGNWNVNLLSDDGTALETSNFGTAPPLGGSPPGAQALAVNASIFAGTTALSATGSSLNVDVTNTVTVGGTVTANQGGAPWAVNETQLAGVALAAPTNWGTAASGEVQGVNAELFAGNVALSATLFGSPPVEALNAYVVNPVTVSVSGTVAATQSGTWTVQQGSAPWSFNLTQIDGTALGAPTDWGTAPATSVVVPGVNAELFVGQNAVSGTNPVPVSATASANSSANPIFVETVPGSTTVVTGTVNVNLISDDGTTLSTSNFGTAPPAAGSPPGAQALAVNASVFGVYNTAIPTLAAGSESQFQVDSTGSHYVNSEGRKQSYRVGVVGFTPIASATAPAISVTGSSTKTIRISRIRLSVSAATGITANVSLLRFSALSGGTANSQAANIAKMDTNDAAATAVVNQWSAAATTATSAGIFTAERYEVITAAVSSQPGAIEWDFGDKNAQSLVLRGTSDFAGFLFSGVGTTPVADCWIEWTEE